MKNSKKNKTYKIIASLVFAMLVIMIYNIFLLILSNYDEGEAATILGFKAYVITTESMSPNVNKGDIIIIKDNATLKVGDIITFKRNLTGETITHRISRITEEGYITKGDSNEEEDPSIVTKDEVQGKMILKINGLGRYIENLKKIRYIFIIIIIFITFILHKKRMSRKKIVRRIKKEKEDEKFNTESEE